MKTIDYNSIVNRAFMFDNSHQNKRLLLASKIRMNDDLFQQQHSQYSIPNTAHISQYTYFLANQSNKLLFNLTENYRFIFCRILFNFLTHSKTNCELICEKCLFLVRARLILVFSVAFSFIYLIYFVTKYWKIHTNKQCS